MKKLHPNTDTNSLPIVTHQKFTDVEEVNNGEFFHDNTDHAVAFIVIVYKDGSRVTRLEDADGSLLDIAGDIRDTKQFVSRGLNGIEFYKNQEKNVGTN